LKELKKPEPQMLERGIDGILPSGQTLVIISGQHRVIAVKALYEKLVLIFSS
jgi:hypothetical protein